jgi:hypothetical protein
MQDYGSEQRTSAWQAGREHVDVPMSEGLVAFLAECHQEIEKAWGTATNPMQLQNLLLEAGWEANETNWVPPRGGQTTHFKNMYKVFTVNTTKQLRLIVSYSSKDVMTIKQHIWYKPTAS